jgi:hypothetical protein
MGSVGGWVKVCVGRIFCSKGLVGDMVSDVGKVEIGWGVDERMESWRGRVG